MDRAVHIRLIRLFTVLNVITVNLRAADGTKRCRSIYRRDRGILQNTQHKTCRNGYTTLAGFSLLPIPTLLEYVGGIYIAAAVDSGKSGTAGNGLIRLRVRFSL